MGPQWVGWGSVPWGDNQGQCLQYRKTSPSEVVHERPLSQLSVLFLNLTAMKLDAPNTISHCKLGAVFQSVRVHELLQDAIHVFALFC